MNEPAPENRASAVLAPDAAPCVVLALRDGADAAEVAARVQEGVDWIELRIDQFARHDAAYVRAEFERLGNVVKLATVRAAPEGGTWNRDEHARLDLYDAVLGVADAVDVELRASICESLVKTAHVAGKLVIGSYHDFKTTPDAPLLEKLFAEGKRLGVDIVKIAATCNTREELQRLAAFTLAHAADAVSVIGMGTEGVSSRIFFPALGSRLTYTFLGEPTAPGQLTCAETLGYLRTFYPERRRAGGQ